MKKQVLISLILSIVIIPAFAQRSARKKNEEATTQAEYEFMIDGDLALGQQQQYLATNVYNEYIGEYIFHSMDIIRAVQDRYVGTVIIIESKKGKKEVVCIPYLNPRLLEKHNQHVRTILNNRKLAQAYTEFIDRRSTFSSALSHFQTSNK